MNWAILRRREDVRWRASLAEGEPAPARQGRVIALVVAVVILLGAVAGAATLGLGGRHAPVTHTTIALRSAAISRCTLTDSQTFPGQTTFGAAHPLPLQSQGLITWLPKAGTVVREGQTLVRVDDRDKTVDVFSILLCLVAGFSVEVLDGTASGLAGLRETLWLQLAVPALLGRRRWPVLAPVVLIPAETLLAPGNLFLGVALPICLLGVAIRRPIRVVAWVVLLYPTLLLTRQVLVGGLFHQSLLSWLSPLVTFGLALIPVGAGMFIQVRRQLVLSLQERAEQAEQEQQQKVIQARQAERHRIAREMHDVLAHRISLVSLHAGALEYRAEAGSKIAASVAIIRESAHQALEDLRDVIGVLRTETDDDAPAQPQPTLDDIPRLIEESRRVGMNLTAHIDLANTTQASLVLGRTAYRIVQEGLTNARKHAPGAETSLAVEGAPGRGVSIVIGNTAPDRGASPSGIPGAGYGLVGLAERAELAGGSLRHSRTSGGGFQLTAQLPWPA